MRNRTPAILKEDLKGKIRWFIALRWVAGGGLFLLIAGARYILKLPLPLLPLCLGDLFLLLYNLVCQLVNRGLQARVEEEDWLARAHRMANAQTSVDLTLLTYLVYFSGGIDNPFLPYFIFHVIMSSILLTNRSAYLQATFAVLLLGLVLGADTVGLIPHHPLGVESGPDFRPRLWNFTARYLALASTMYIAVYLTTAVVNQLRAHERELEVSNRQLAEQDRRKSQYVMTVSHDIQASLSAIESCLQAVLKGFTGPVAEASRDMIDRAVTRTQQLLRFVRDLLDVSRMRAEERMVPEPVRLDELVGREAELYRSRAEAKGLTLAVENRAGAAVIQADSTALQQLVSNLLSNAVRYTPEGGSVRIGLELAGKPGGVLLRVSDTGIGIPEQELPGIFNDFFRAANARSFAASGTGLGLSIVKKIVEMHNGKVQVESEVGKGTTFTVFLPCRHRTPQGTNTNGAAPDDST